MPASNPPLSPIDPAIAACMHFDLNFAGQSGKGKHIRQLTGSSVSSVESATSLFEEPYSTTTSSTLTTPETSPKYTPLGSVEPDPETLTLPTPLIPHFTSLESYLLLPTSSIPCPKPPVARLHRPLTKTQHKQELSFHEHIEFIYREAVLYDVIRNMLIKEGRPFAPGREVNYEDDKCQLWEWRLREMQPPAPMPLPQDLTPLRKERDYPAYAGPLAFLSCVAVAVMVHVICLLLNSL